MTAARRRRTDAIQPELPLRPSPADGPVPTTPDDAGDRGWRLDEQTRQAGLRGVAFARAQLLASEATRKAQLQRRGRGSSGRAA
jgi:hypothetical protein